MINRTVLTPSQEVAVEKIEAFLKKKVSGDLSSRVFRLTGKAGTGKTFVIKHCLSDYLSRDNNKEFDAIFGSKGTPNVLGVTPSHKAKNVLKDSIPNCKTFASTYGLKKHEHNDGSVSFRRDKSISISMLPCKMKYKVFVFDECSMIGKKMMNHIMKDTYTNAKIIFMGDRGQLPPIEDKDDFNSLYPDIDSPVFDLQLEKESQHELTEIVRQTDMNPIIHVSSLIYDQIFGDKDVKKALDLIRLPVFDSESKSGVDVIPFSELYESYKSEENYLKTKIIAYRRNTVDKHNFDSRQVIYDGTNRVFIPGEIIYMNNTFTKPKEGSVNSEFTLFNSDEYIIERVIEDELENGYESYKLMIDPMEYMHLIDVNSPYIPIPKGNGLDKWKAELDEIRQIALDPLTSQPGVEWRRFYALKEMFGDVSYGYTFTGHKAQGSTYENIYVDVNDIFTVSMISNKRKLQALYTAITRAQKKVLFIKK